MKNFRETSLYPLLLKKQSELAQSSITTLFENNPARLQNFSLEEGRFFLDFSKVRWDEEVLEFFSHMADELKLGEAIEALFEGKMVNRTEKRPAIHTALRDFSGKPLMINGENIQEEITRVRKRIEDFSKRFRAGRLKGFSGKPLKYIVNIGIGGSKLGPETVVFALKDEKSFPVYYLSNIDGEEVKKVLKLFPLDETLFLVVSKSFSTKETLKNAEYIKETGEKLSEDFVLKHFAAITSKPEKAEIFGIDREKIFPMWDGVGGRYSLWSAAGLSIALSLGYEVFEALLKGAEKADKHFRNQAWKENIPVLLAFATIWHTHFWGYHTEAYIPYRQRLKFFPFWLQQLVMESNGKNVQTDGRKTNYSTSPVVFGDTGTDAQHSFFQMLHQGTQVVPVTFLAYVHSGNSVENHDRFLLANLLAQAESLAFGKQNDLPYKHFEGNRPSLTLLFDRLTPENLGFLLALFEHKTYVESIFWNINAFDQFGVELGKINADKWFEKLSQSLDIKNPVASFIKNHLYHD